MAFRYILVTISQFITFTDLPERFTLSAEGRQVVCESLDMHQQFMRSSSSRSLRVDVHKKKIPNLLSYVRTAPQMPLHKLWPTHLDADLSGRASADEFAKAARLRPNVWALPASEVGAGLNPTSGTAAIHGLLRWATCGGLRTLEMNSFIFSRVPGVIITPHSPQVWCVYRNPSFFVWERY